MRLLSIVDAIDLVALSFVNAGCRTEVALSVARALVAAEADGLEGHGLTRIPTYLGMLRSGKVDGHARPSLTRSKPGTIAIDAAHGFAYPAIDLAVSELPSLAFEQGIAAASVRRSNHCGVAGLPCEALAKRGLIALLFANSPAAMAPWGGRQLVFGTNPMAFAAPVEGRPPVVVDLAMSKVARGRIVKAQQLDLPIPAGWAVDEEGNSTTDAGRALQGAMLPFGEAKGSALALIVEVLAACLPGAKLSFEASSFLDEHGSPPSTGQFLLCINPSVFGSSNFGERTLALVQEIEKQLGVRVPGVRRLENRARSARDGISVSAQVYAVLKNNDRERSPGRSSEH